MYQILYKERLNENVQLMRIHAPYVAKKAQAGQFVILRADETSERIPLTIADYDRAAGTVTVVFQEVGRTTMKLGLLSAGDCLSDFAGPLGVASHFDGVKRVCVIGGGLGTAIAYPQAKALFAADAEVDVIVGFRNKELVFFENELAACSHSLLVATDDGSNGKQGFVTNFLQEKIEAGASYDLVIAIGPLVMMRAVCNLTKQYGLKTVVSMNPIMIDGTGMCGGCRLTVGGETKFACVDGPDFDGHLVDFDEAIKRSSFYREFEQEAVNSHICRMTGEAHS